MADARFDQGEFWARDDDFRDGVFATLRRECPIRFFGVPEFGGFPTGAGHWVLTSYEHIRPDVHRSGSCRTR